MLNIGYTFITFISIDSTITKIKDAKFYSNSFKLTGTCFFCSGYVFASGLRGKSACFCTPSTVYNILSLHSLHVGDYHSVPRNQQNDKRHTDFEWGIDVSIKKWNVINPAL